MAHLVRRVVGQRLTMSSEAARETSGKERLELPCWMDLASEMSITAMVSYWDHMHRHVTNYSDEAVKCCCQFALAWPSYGLNGFRGSQNNSCEKGYVPIWHPCAEYVDHRFT